MDLKRVHGVEWLSGLAGLAILVGLSLQWSGGDTGFESFSLLKLILELTGVAASLVPLVVASSSKTDVPVVWALFTAMAAGLAAAVLLIRLIFSPDGGLDSGFFVVLAGSLLLCIGSWRSVARGG